MGNLFGEIDTFCDRTVEFACDLQEHGKAPSLALNLAEMRSCMARYLEADPTFPDCDDADARMQRVALQCKLEAALRELLPKVEALSVETNVDEIVETLMLVAKTLSAPIKEFWSLTDDFDPSQFEE